MPKELPPDEAHTALLFLIAIMLAVLAAALSCADVITTPISTVTNQGETHDTAN